MATSRGSTPPVNLKERIAALQQRSVSPNTHQSAQAVPRGLPSPGAGALRDRIAKFEEKGGLPVPRGSFGMGVPPPAENPPPKKRGELYGKFPPGLGRPSGAPVSRSGSPLPSADEAPAPRKRCISTGAALSGSSSKFSTDEPVPALPNGLSGAAPRRNSLAVNFGPGRRIMSASEPGMDFNNASSSSLGSEKAPETTEEQSPSPEPVLQPTAEETSSAVEEPQMLEVSEDARESSDPPLVDEQPFPIESGASDVDMFTKDPPAPTENHPFPLYDVSQNLSQSSTVEQDSKDGLSDYESAPQSAVSRPSPSLPKHVSPIPPTHTASPPPEPTPAPAEIIVVSPPASPSEKVTKRVAASITISVPNPTVSVPPSFPTPTGMTEVPVQSKSTFKAVVHRKVAEPTIFPAPPTLVPPQVTQQRPGIGGNVVENPPSPGCGDLVVLLEDAALLELRLTEGDRTGPKAKEVLTPTNATFQTDTRHASASTLTEHAHVPSTDSGSFSAGSMSIPSIREPFIDGEIPEEEETDGRSLASTTFSQRSPSHRKYLSNIYRLTGRRSSSYMPGTYPRDSMSVSSEDSSPVTTPSDNGKRKGFGIGWPSASPKKGAINVGRSSSFADKIFHRNRTKSNVSTADQDRSSLYESSQPNLSIAFSSELSPEGHTNGVDIVARPTSWISPGDSNSEFSPASSLLDKDIFDAFPSVPQTLPPGFHLDGDDGDIERASTLPAKGRKQVNPRLSVV